MMTTPRAPGSTARIDFLTGSAWSRRPSPDAGYDDAPLDELLNACLLIGATEECPVLPGLGFTYSGGLKDGHGGRVLRPKEDGGNERSFVILPGDWIRGWEQEYDTGPRELVDILASWDFRPTRVDLCIDTDHPDLTPERWYRLVQADRVATLLKTHRAICKDGTCQTLYIGKRGSPLMVRIYDKVAERAARGKPLPSAATMTRVELELRDDLARRVWDNLIETRRKPDFVRTLARALVLGKCRPLAGPKRGNAQRVKTLPEWLSVVNNEASLTLPAPYTETRPAVRLDNALATLKRSAAMLALIEDTFGAGTMERLAALGRSKYGPLELAALDLPRGTIDAVALSHGLARKTKGGTL